MKGHIRQRSKDTYAIILDLGPDPRTGARRQRWITVHGGKKDAERELRRLLHEIDAGTYIDDPEKMTVKQYLEKWLAEMRTRVSLKTWERYAEIVRGNIIPVLGRLLLAKLQPLHITSAYSHWLEKGRKRSQEGGGKGLSPQTVLHYHRILSAAMKQAVRWQLIIRNPVEAVDPPRVTRKEISVLTADQVELLIAAARGTRFHIPVLLAVTAGLRRGEILAARWQDVDLGEGLLSICHSLEQTTQGLAVKSPKSGKSRVVVLPSLTVETLRQHRQEQMATRLLLGEAYEDYDLICCENDGRPILPSSITQNFCRILKKAGLPHIRFHDLRHTHAVLLIGLGTHPKVIAERLGHSNISITMDVYGHVLPSMQEEAARRLDDILRPSPSKMFANPFAKDKSGAFSDEV